MRRLVIAALVAAATGILTLIVLRSLDGPTGIAPFVGGVVGGAFAVWVTRERES